MLRVEKLNKQFGGIHAVKDVDLTVEANRIHAIIGPNGAGKSTLVAQIGGALKPDSGSIHFAGRNITRMRPHKRARFGLARSFQITSVIAPLTLLENAMLAAQSKAGHSYRFWAPLERDAGLRYEGMRALAAAGLDARADVPAGAASHGEQRQLEFAMALALKPKLLLLDEPTAGMSKEESGKMIALLNTLRGKLTIVLIEHDMDAVFALADTASVLVGGRIIATGSIAQIRANAEVQRAYLGEQCA